VIILLLAGILTPSPDITSQLLLGIPLVILYEISIIISKYSQPKRAV
jgi:sec-independent protein translocase protein TatC